MATRRVLVVVCSGLVAMRAAPPQRPTPVADRDAAWVAHQELAADSPFAQLPWRVLGPTSEGARVEAIAVPAGSRNTIYVGPGAGNVWKTTNDGLTWTPIFDHESAFAVGDIAVAPSNPNIVWVGTGEVQPRFAGYAFSGTGIFKSTNAGATWTNMGLHDSQHIAKIVIDPSNPDVVFAAAMGHQWPRITSAACSRRPMAVGPGRSRCIWTTRRGRLTSRWIRRTTPFCMPRCGRSRPDRRAASTAPSTPAGPGRT